MFHSEEWLKSLASFIGEVIRVGSKEQAYKRPGRPLISVRVMDISKLSGSISILGLGA